MRRGPIGCVTALASQSLSIMIALIPYVRETFRRHLSQKQAVMLVEFDKLKRVGMPHHAILPSPILSQIKTCS
jgi:vacuolar protein sorting-associated protein 54